MDGRNREIYEECNGRILKGRRRPTVAAHRLPRSYGFLVLILNLDKASVVRHDIIMTFTRLILPHLWPIVLWCQENQLGSSCWFLIWMIWTCRMLIFRIRTSLQTISRRFIWGLFLGLENLRSETLFLKSAIAFVCFHTKFIKSTTQLLLQWIS